VTITADGASDAGVGAAPEGQPGTAASCLSGYGAYGFARRLFDQPAQPGRPRLLAAHIRGGDDLGY
jgi:hypothetical protein